jgi:succinoglycan biosynthesis protein ExoM
LRSLFVQAGVEDRLAAIVVADNDPEGSAAEVVERLRPSAPVPLVYVHAPVPGVATARNAGLAATEAPLIAFLDDDEAASPGWLSALLSGLQTTGANVVFGPIQGRVPEDAGWAKPYLERFFGRDGPATTTLIQEPYGCGNSLMLRSVVLPGPAPFDTAMDQSGGEDDVLFAGVRARGGRFGWASDAWVDEYAPPHRATLRYALTRAFAYGQSPSQAAAARRDWLGVVRWMAVGAVQTAVRGLKLLPLWIARSPRRAETLDGVARGLGKVFWTRRFEPRLYGAAMLKAAPRVDQPSA